MTLIGAVFFKKLVTLAG